MVRFDKKANKAGRKYVQDRRGRRPARRTSRGGGLGGGFGAGRGGGMPAGLPMGKVGGVGGIILMIIFVLMSGVLSGGGDGGVGQSLDAGGGASAQPVDPAQDETVEFMGALMYDIQTVWAEEIPNYTETEIVIFTGAVSTNGCGNATSASGPFYCPAPNDHLVYVDLDFYDELSRRFGAPGDFAQAYVIAHEVGHHIQSITGISDQVRDIQQRDSSRKNEMSVRQELQADCFAGVWAHSAQNRTNSDGTPIIEPGDIDEGLAAAASVGDDRIQEMTGQQVSPHNWTHGSAAARKAWFTQGLNTGDPDSCDTYSVSKAQVGL